jgi:hypothetical protein
MLNLSRDFHQHKYFINLKKKPITLQSRLVHSRLENRVWSHWSCPILNILIFKIWTQFSRIGSHLNENLQSGSESGYSQMWDQLVLTMKTGLRTDWITSTDSPTLNVTQLKTKNITQFTAPKIKIFIKSPYLHPVFGAGFISNPLFPGIHKVRKIYWISVWYEMMKHLMHQVWE